MYIPTYSIKKKDRKKTLDLMFVNITELFLNLFTFINTQTLVLTLTHTHLQVYTHVHRTYSPSDISV